MANYEIINTVICYNNIPEVVEYAYKLSKLDCSNLICLAVVVNKLENGTIKELVELLSETGVYNKIIIPKQNLGYMNGMLEAYKIFCNEEGAESIKFIVMSNTDISYPDPCIYRKLMEKKYPKDVWCIGPAVYVPKRKTFDNPISEKRRSKQEIERLVFIFKTRFVNTLYIWFSDILGKIKKIGRGSSHEVYEVHGCYFILKKDAICEMLKKPFGALLYSEESYVAELVWHNSKIEYYDADLLIEHLEHSVTGKIDRKKIAHYLADSLKTILRDFYE